MNEYMYVCNEYNRRENKRKEMYKPISSLRSMGGRKNEHKKKSGAAGEKELFLLSGRLLCFQLL
jgi:hypothetical protein